MINTPEPGIYKHYKEGKRYRVLGTSKHTETGERTVMYEPLYETDDEDRFCNRPLEMFLDEVEVDGKAVPRFKQISD